MQDILRQTPDEVPQGDSQQDSDSDSEVFLKVDEKAATRISSQILYWHRRMYDECELIDFVNKHLAPWEDCRIGTGA